MKGLRQLYGIEVTSHDFWSQRGILPQLVAMEYRKAAAVLVVCNQQLFHEWHHQGGSEYPLVPVLKHFIYSSVGKKDFAKLAVVLLRTSDRRFIPEELDSHCTRRYTVDRVQDIASFVKGEPRFAKP